MDIDRKKDQGGLEIAKKRVTFCLNQLEKAKTFSRGKDWNTLICKRLTVEEIIGALVSAEQELSKQEI